MTCRAAFLLALTLLALAACVPAGQSAPSTRVPTPAPTPASATAVLPSPTSAPAPLAVPTLDPTRLFGSSSRPLDASRINETVKEFKTGMRQASGLYAKLGPQADEFFRQIDLAEAAAVQDLRRQMGLDVKPKVMPAPLRPRADSASSAYQILGMATVFGTLFQATDLVQRPDDNLGARDQPLTVKENDFSFNENVRAHTKTQMQVTGCRVEMTVDVTINGEKDGNSYEERSHGKLSLPVCPDKNGQVPMDITMQTSATVSITSFHFQTNFTGHAVGVVDDEANLVGLQQDAQTDSDLQKGQDAPGGATHSMVQGTMQYTMNGLQPDEEVSVGNEQGDWHGTPNVVQEMGPLIQVGHKLALMVELLALRSAEAKWKDSFCVAVRVGDKTQTVAPGSETPVTARLQHLFEGMELSLPVVAILRSGGASFTPEGVKVPAPANFRYLAPDQPDMEAVVELESRSRRGIGKVEVTFLTEDPSYTVDAPWEGGDTIRIQGTICSFSKPFTLKITGRKINAGPYTGKVEFTPTDAASGKWLWTGSYSVPYSPDTQDRGGSTYQVTGLKEGKPKIVLSPFEHQGWAPGIFSQTEHIPGYEIPLTRASGSCPRD